MTTVNKYLNNMEEVEKMKKIYKNTIKLCVFLIFASLPFLTVTQLIGMDSFLDSFENSDYYIFLENDGLIASKISDEQYIIILKSSHPDFKIEDGDTTVYWINEGEIVCNKIEKIDSIGSLKRYQKVDMDDSLNMPIYENQIIGKVINTIDNNIWNSISLKIWEISIQKFNLNSLISSN